MFKKRINRLNAIRLIMQYIDNSSPVNLKFSNVESRPNKTAKGFTKNLERMRTQGRKTTNDNTLLKLAV